MSLKLYANNGIEVPVRYWTFPGGERNCQIQLPDYPVRSALIRCDYECSDDLVALILLANAVKHAFGSHVPVSLTVPYFPFARQDRVMTPGEPHALQAVVQVINMLNFSTVITLDPHSDVLVSLFSPGHLVVKTQWDLWATKIGTEPNSALVSPDAGAAKKIYKLAEQLSMPVIEASKIRDPKSGEITQTKISFDCEQYDTLYVVDDICDGGRTFVELAKAIREQSYAGELVLCVTHGIFSRGLQPLHCYDKIYCVNLMNSAVNLTDFNN